MTDLADVEARVRTCVQTMTADIDSPADQTLRSLDSLGLVELVVVLEEHFVIEIPDLMLTDEAFGSIRALTRLVGVCQTTRAG